MTIVGTDKNGDEIAEVSVLELDTMFKEIRNKTIDDFAEKLREICSNHSVGADSKNNNEPLYAHKDGTWHSLIDDVVEQLKEGSVDNE